MNIEKKRKRSWLILIIISVLLYFSQFLVNDASNMFNDVFNMLTKEKAVIKVYAPENMKKAFKSALKDAKLSNNYQIEIVKDKATADVVVDYNKEDDASYKLFAFSPFMASMNISNNSEMKSLVKQGTLSKNRYSDNAYDIDIAKVVDEAIGEGSWENLGISDNGELVVVYPSKDSIYWNSFKDFMLANLNDGEYPKNTEEYENANSLLEQFINSHCTESYTDLLEKYERMGGFNNKVIWILPESSIYELYSKHSKYTDIYGPLVTTYFNYYMKGQTDIGTQLVNGASENFYTSLKGLGYRNLEYTTLSNLSSGIDYERNVYTLIEKSNISFEDIE